MSTILDKIIAHKKEEVARTKTQTPVQVLEKSAYFERSCHSLKSFVRNPDKTGIIAEFKRKSPSKDVINDQAEVVSVTQDYTQNGASALSVLTDTSFFGGTDEDLKKARAHNRIPILRKDFIIDEYQIIEAKAIGADVILLICECLNKQEIKYLTRFAHKLGLEVLLEMHTEEQLDKVSSENKIIGINNRNLKTFEVNIDRSIALADKLPETTLKIAESGISDPRVVRKMKKAGFDGFLMGEHFMKQANPGEAFRKFAEQIKG